MISFLDALLNYDARSLMVLKIFNTTHMPNNICNP
jgi:hypothetical protein